jgi:23S rRNA-/tRNA-specific pseudouridylate synthase
MLPGHLLHAARLALRHPMTGQPLEIHAPLPELFAAIIGQ